MFVPTDFDIDSLWYLVDPLSARDVSALIAGYEPTLICFDDQGPSYFLDERDMSDHTRIMRVKIAFIAVTNAILGDTLQAKITYQSKPTEDYNPPFPLNSTKPQSQPYSDQNKPDWSNTFVQVDHVKKWLLDKGITSGFFFPNKCSDLDYLNPEHPRYAPKLAALINAWLAYTPSPGKTTKQVLTKWLNEHAGEFGLTDDDGKPQASLVEIASVANWDTKGGAPRTPI